MGIYETQKEAGCNRGFGFRVYRSENAHNENRRDTKGGKICGGEPTVAEHDGWEDS